MAVPLRVGPHFCLGMLSTCGQLIVSWSSNESPESQSRPRLRGFSLTDLVCVFPGLLLYIYIKELISK